MKRFHHPAAWLTAVLLVAALYFAGRSWQAHRSDEAYQQRLKKSAPGPDQRPNEWFWLQRTFPYERYDLAVYQQALARVQQMSGLRKATATPEWEFVGPTNVGGRIVDIEYDPLNPVIVYAGAATGGVFKSVDEGLTWSPIFDRQAVLTIGDIAVDPLNPQVLYVGTGEANGGHNNFPGGGVYKSVDGGDTWNYSGLASTTSIGRICIDPINPRRVFVAAVGSYFAPNSERGVFVSEDSGRSWNISLFVSDSTGAIDLVMDPNNPAFMLAAVWERVRRPVSLSSSHLYGPTSGIYRTVDGGKSWQHLGPGTGLPDSRQENVGRIGLAMFPNRTQIIYALYTDGTRISGLYRTDDSGDSWRALDPKREVVGSGSFSWYFGQIRVHPTDPNRLFVLDIALNYSADAGQTWPIRYGYDGYADLHVDHHALAFHPTDPDILIDGNDGGINRSEDGGMNWTKVADLPVTQFYEIAVDPSFPERAYGGTQDNGTIRTLNGRPDGWEQIWGGDGFFVAIDPNDPNVIYAESQYGNLVKSIDGGQTFVYARRGIDSREPANWSTPLAIDPQNSLVLYTATNRVYRSDNGAESWQAISGNLTRNLADSRVGTITALSVAPSNSNFLYVGTDDGLVWTSRDAGQSWEQITAGLPFRWVTEIAVHPDDALQAVVSFSGLKWRDPQPHLFLTRDGGMTWEDIGADLPDVPLNSVLIDPLAPQRIYVASDVGVFVSLDSGHSWSVLDRGMPAVVCSDLKYQSTTAELLVGTYGRSLYKLKTALFSAVRNAEAVEPMLTFYLSPAFPNPFNQTARLRLRVEQESHLLIRIIAADGRLVRLLNDSPMQRGVMSVDWDGLNDAGQAVASGVYFFHALDRRRGVVLMQKVACIR